ncbi:hypothetical protein SDRG_10479 [Saprolegnia diclina VS20]|uniref:Uncharacterized protein n=1 Tax=Saprolegnia diclina (strain VS20) TaxID=1156394 RepID=T0QEJ8_SAPDV|nr:hypothetical protein SDRG_10479 [Saprolegnia diclina VS20]EQC31965.1 hypothetical protein SDRG_10479 [Saprolegnia diclina VS20]|eukprot:XP_008614693.1 hypothetical protein SDRG_10479 [Saprolegnia diclina VS20]
MYLVTWPLRVYLAWSALSAVYFAGVLIVPFATWMRPVVPHADVYTSCALGGLCVVIAGLVRVRMANKLASLAPLLVVLFTVFVLFGAIFILAFSEYYAVLSVPYERAQLEKIEAGVVGEFYYDRGYLTDTNSDCSMVTWRERERLSAFEDAHCAKQGKAYCNAFSLRKTLFQPLIFDNKTEHERIAALLQTSSFFGVTIDDHTTLSQFCASVAPSVLTSEPSLDVACDGCRALVAAPEDTSSLGNWVYEHCPLTTVDPMASYCIMSASAKLYPYLLTYPEAKRCRRSILRLNLVNRVLICFGEKFDAALQSYTDAMAYVAVVLAGLAFVLFFWVSVAQMKRDAIDADDELMLEAMLNARASQQ